MTSSSSADTARARVRAGGVGLSRPLLVTGLSVLILVVLAPIGLFAGSKDTDLGEVLAVLVGQGDDYVRTVVESRWPRTVLGAMVGGCLAVAGVIVQGITRNPLGDPGLIGVTIGASAAVVTATAFLGFSGGAATVWIALPGAVLAVLVVFGLGRRGGGSLVPLILAGAVVSAVLGAYIQAMTLLKPQVFDSFRHWVIGSLAGRGFDTLWQIGPVVVLGAVLAVGLSSGLNALALGDDVAASLGVRVTRVRGAGILAATLLAGAATAAVGPVAFVGLAVPHLTRALVGTDHRWQIPVAAVLGGALLIGADILGRVVARPEELMVGIVTAFLGAPALLWAVRRGRGLR